MKLGIKEFILIGLLLAIPIWAYFWVFQPADANMKTQQQILESKQKKLAQLSKAMKSIKNLDAEIQKLTEAVKFFESKLPDKQEIHIILEQVTKIADQHQLETRLFKTLKTKPYAHYNEQPIEMEIYGDFDAFYQFLLDVEKLQRITKINNMMLVKDQKNEGAMSAKFTLSIFYDNKQTVKQG